jgi:hypothetical protein
MKRRTMSSENVRCWLSYIVTGFGVLGVLGLAVLIMLTAAAGEEGDTAKLLLSSILPLLGTWVGMVLAYYFAKENFESAARATEKLAGLEKLRSVPVTTAMIPVAQADKRQLKAGETAEGLLLKDLVDQMAKAKRNRLPVLDEKGKAVYVIHLSSVTDFIAEKSLAGTKPDDVAKLTIADLKTARTDLFDRIRAWVCVPRDGTLADAKTAMEGLPNCSDVFVTESGRTDEPVIGWVTNVEIAFHSKA